MGLGDRSVIPANGVHVCDKGHHHLGTSWTIYVVDPESAKDATSYAKALYPIEVFDTQEQAKKLYSLDAFSPPNGPPSWSMVVPGGAIAVFQGGKYGFPSVKPEWEDPAARNGGELRFVFAQGINPLEFVDDVFGCLVNWMAEHPHYDGASILGLFVKNVYVGSNADALPSQAIQFRVWITEAVPQLSSKVTWAIAHSMAKVVGDAGAKGTITYRSLGELIERAKPGQSTQQRNGPLDENGSYLKLNLRLGVPVFTGDNNGSNRPVSQTDRR